MAQGPKQSGGDGDANFVRQIVTDPKHVPDVMLLTGYLGASSEEGHERLYLSLDLSSYVEIPRAAILHRAAVPNEQDSNGAVTLWVKKDAALQYKMAPAAQALANYFAGAIQAGVAQGAAEAGALPITIGGPACGITLPNVCQIVSAVCSVFTCGIDCTIFCPTPRAPCPTHGATCPPYATCAPQCTVVCTLWPQQGCTLNPVVCGRSAGCSPACSPHPICSANCAAVSPGCILPSIGPVCPTRPCTPATCNPVICNQTQGLQQGCTHNVACAKTPVVCTQLPVCFPPTPNFECGASQHHPCTAACAQAQAFNPGGANVPESYAPGCWYSWNACPTQYGGCGPRGTFHTPCCPW